MPGLKQHIVGLCGYANSGKDTVADLLVTHAGFLKLSWADPLRAEICDGFDVPMQLLTDRTLKETPTPALALRRGPLGLIGAVACAAAQSNAVEPPGDDLNGWLDEPRSPRQIMQLWGTEYRRRQNPKYWTRQLMARVHARMEEHERNFVITDCRFENEVEALRSMGGELWQVARPGAAPAAGSHHVSVTDGSEFVPDTRVDNSGDIRALQAEVLGLFWARDAGLNRVKVEIE